LKILAPETESDLLVEEDDDLEVEEVDEDEEQDEEEDECDQNHDCSKHSHSEEESSEQEKKAKSKKRKSNEATEEEEEDEDEDEDEDEEDEEDGGDIDPEFKNSVIKSLGNAMADDEENSDLDDEAMMKLDESIASAFKLRKKDKKHEMNLLQYKLRALDFIQELLKTTYRLDLITVRFQQFNKIFETFRQVLIILFIF
jgi:hypothetical protein